MATHFTKDVNATLDYSVDWSSWLASGETISTSAWTVTPGVDVQSDSHSETGATIWLSGGTARRSYRATNRITTSVSRTDERSIVIDVQER